MNKKHNVFFILFIAIFTLVLISSAMLTGINAKFLSSDSASDSANVAKFNVVIDITEDGNVELTTPIEMMPGGVEKIHIKIESKSEVAVQGTITLSSTGNLPLTITGGTSTFSIGAGNGSFTTEFTISWPAEKNDAKYSGEVDIVSISVVTEQVD